MKKRKLGINGPEISATGLGCMGMSEFYGNTDDEQSKKVILSALENGITMLDTADMYGSGHNERLISQVIKEWPGDISIATKFGIVREPGSLDRRICGKPEYVKKAAEASLKRLDIETIDIYYIHRIDPEVPIEDTMGAMSELVRQGKIKYIGLSEPSSDTVLKAHAVHPVTCIQSEYSIFTRDVEEHLLPTLRKNGIGFVAFSPLGRGILTGKLTRDSINNEKDFRNTLPRTSQENFQHNINLVNSLEGIAKEKGITLSQLALAWVLSKGDDIVPIPGTRNLKYLMENIEASSINLSPHETDKIEEIVYSGAVRGERYTPEGMQAVNL